MKRFLFLFTGCLLFGITSACKSLVQLDFSRAIKDSSAALTPRPEKPDIDAIRKKYYRTWTSEMRRAVNNRQILVGMDKNQVQVATRIEEYLVQREISQSQEFSFEIWSLWKTPNGWAFTKVQPSRKFAVRFDDGMVTDLRPQ